MTIKSIFAVLRKLVLPRSRLSSSDYWISRYRSDGTSGPGSYGRLAAFKASVLNEFVHSNGIESIIEFGSGDGNQLKLARYPHYTGYDVSLAAVTSCRKLFEDDAHKEFYLVSEYSGQTADLVMSLDVVFHLTEDHVFESYMHQLFDAASRFVIIYSSNTDATIEPTATHVRHRRFTQWVEKNVASPWALATKIPNAYPYNGDYQSTSFSDFYVYKKA